MSGRSNSCCALGVAMFAATLIMAAPSAFAAGTDRFALVVGNSTYLESPLRNPVNDARAMSEILRLLDFQVLSLEDASKASLEQAILQFTSNLSPTSTGLFYYAGHGVQVSGRNYLIPVDAEIGSAREVRIEATPVNLLLDELNYAGNSINIVILDACRNNPYERRFRGGGTPGLAAVDAASGTMIAYATAPGSVALDGQGNNGLYTEELLRVLDTPGLKVEEVFKQVRGRVAKRTHKNQIPWESSSLIGDFVFNNRPVTSDAGQGSRQADETQARLDEQRAYEKAEQESTLVRARSATKDKRKSAGVERLLREATADLAADRLTVPAGKNAFSRYQAVLTLDPANEAALKGLHEILTRYLVLTKAAVNENDFDLAERYLDKAATVSPGAESITAARAAMTKRAVTHEEDRRRIESGARRAAEEEDRRRIESSQRRAAEEERQRQEAVRRATEDELRRLQAALLAAEEDRRRVRAEREAEIERRQLEQDAILMAKLEADFRRSQEIAALLDAAQEAFEADRLTSPPDDNALSGFKSVLVIDAENAEADAGIQRVANRYAQLAVDEIAAYRFDKAESLVDKASTIYAGIPSIAPARQKLRDGRAAYTGRRPVSKPPFRMTMPPVAGTSTCSAYEPMPEIETYSAGFMRRDGDLDYVPTYTDVSDSWQDSGINKEPRAERLYILGRQEKLDGALMYWYRALGTQCIKVFVDAYLVDLQTGTVYAEEGTTSNLQELTITLVDQFKKGRRALNR